MTVLVGILCEDGVVIGSDSAMASSPIPGQITMGREEGQVLKIEIIDGQIITAMTGNVGLGQRCNDQIANIFRELKRPFQAPKLVPGIGAVGTPIQQMLMNQISPTKVPFNEISPVEVGRTIAQLVINDFRRTQSALQMNNPQHGWGMGALLAFVKGDTPYLIEFDAAQFHPEFKGQPDPQRGDRVWRGVSMGSGQPIADTFLAHAYRMLFGSSTPRVDRAKLAVVWTVDHVKRYNTGLIGGKIQLAVLQKVKGEWTAHHEDVGQAEQQMKELEEYISGFGKKSLETSGAADLHAAIDKEN